ncbi:MAG: hypothetical protein RLZZ164_58 [Actinomycetota bacterium]|jgi:thiol-disulfide isomerase/thioredoxin
MTTIELTLIGKPGCHLCDDAEVAIAQVLEQLAAEPASLGGAVVTMNQLNMLESEELTARYSEEIPVLLINGQVHNYWRIDQQRLRTALLEAAK